jgi:putative sterol carrier protein
MTPASHFWTSPTAVEDFIAAWNQKPSRQALRGLAIVRLQCVGLEPDRALTLEWDEDGKASLRDNLVAPRFTITGSGTAWDSFFTGRVSASRAVLTGLLRFQGNFASIAPYSQALNLIGTVGGEVLMRAY